MSTTLEYQNGSSSGNIYNDPIDIHPVQSYVDETVFSSEIDTTHKNQNTNQKTSSSYIDIEQDDDDDDEDTLVITYPEKNWKLLLGSFFGISASWGLFFICGTFQDYYSKNQLKQYTSFQISWIFSLYYFLIVSGNLLTGLYFDFYGFQKFLCLLLIPGFLLLPFVQTFWEIISVFALLGLGGGIIIPPILGCISDYFYEKRNFANSLAITGGNIVGIVFPIILQKGFTSIGYKNTSFIVCGMFLIQLGICLLLCRDRKELRRKLQPDETFLKLYFQESFDYTSLFTSLRFILVTIGITTAEVSTGVLLIYITSYCSNILHFSDSESFNIVTILNAGTLFGGCFFGMFLANKIGTINSVMIACFNLLVLNFVVWLWLTQKVPKLMYLYSLLLGFNCGGMMSLCPSICGIVSNYYDFGKKYSTIYFVVGVGFLAGIPVSGIIIGNSNKANFVYFIVYCSTLIFLSLLCFAILKFTYLKRNIKYKISERQSVTPTGDSSDLNIKNNEFIETEYAETPSIKKEDLKLSFKKIICTKY